MHLITALLVLVLDPLTVLLTLAATAGRCAKLALDSAAIPNMKAAW